MGIVCVGKEDGGHRHWRSPLRSPEANSSSSLLNCFMSTSVSFETRKLPEGSYSCFPRTWCGTFSGESPCLNGQVGGVMGGGGLVRVGKGAG